MVRMSNVIAIAKTPSLNASARPVSMSGKLSIPARANTRSRVADRLRVLQLPRLRPRAGDHRVGPRLSRALGHAPELVAPTRSPVLYTQIEERLAELVGAEDTLVLPTITLI